MKNTYIAYSECIKNQKFVEIFKKKFAIVRFYYIFAVKSSLCSTLKTKCYEQSRTNRCHGSKSWPNQS